MWPRGPTQVHNNRNACLTRVRSGTARPATLGAAVMAPSFRYKYYRRTGTGADRPLACTRDYLWLRTDVGCEIQRIRNHLVALSSVGKIFVLFQGYPSRYPTMRTAASLERVQPRPIPPFSHTCLSCAGREAYLRTRQALDEASAVSSMLFLDDGHNDRSNRFQEAKHERDDSLDAAAGASGWMADTARGNRASALFGGSSLFLPAGEADSGSGKGSEGMAGGILAAAAGRRAPLGVLDIRPEEKQFCDAFLELQDLMVSLLAQNGKWSLGAVLMDLRRCGIDRIGTGDRYLGFIPACSTSLGFRAGLFSPKQKLVGVEHEETASSSLILAFFLKDTVF